MIVEGKKIAEEIYAQIGSELDSKKKHPVLCVLTCAPNAETKKYLNLKKDRAAALGIDMMVVDFYEEIPTTEVLDALDTAMTGNDGIIVQLPFPNHIDVDTILKKIPLHLDTDAINYDGSGEVLPPVIAAIKEIADRHGVEFAGKQVVVVGQGRLVGKPAAIWANTQGSMVTVIDKGTENTEEILRAADIIISGAGSPGLITPDKIKEGVIIFDAGTSEEGGMLRGDASPECAAKCALFTPVPGGIGPITIAALLRNLVVMSKGR